jgi:membrane protein implicated in regulation of membrane protease activity
VNTQNISTNTKLKIQVAILTVVSLALLPTIATAHGGEEHLIGTVAQISDTSITVKTTAGKIVEVTCDEKTTYARAKQTIHKTDIKVGDRIVIHAREGNEKLVAHTVEIGAATVAKPVVKHSPNWVLSGS